MKNTVCLIDENVDDWALVRHSLRLVSTNISLSVYESGEEFLDNFAIYDLSSLPAGIIMDLNLPRHDGLATLREIKRHPALDSVPVAVFSSFIGRHREDDYLNGGAGIALKKAMDFDRYRENLVAILRHFGLHQAESA